MTCLQCGQGDKRFCWKCEDFVLANAVMKERAEDRTSFDHYIWNLLMAMVNANPRIFSDHYNLSGLPSWQCRSAKLYSRDAISLLDSTNEETCQM